MFRTKTLLLGTACVFAITASLNAPSHAAQPLKLAQATETVEDAAEKTKKEEGAQENTAAETTGKAAEDTKVEASTEAEVKAGAEAEVKAGTEAEAQASQEKQPDANAETAQQPEKTETQGTSSGNTEASVEQPRKQKKDNAKEKQQSESAGTPGDGQSTTSTETDGSANASATATPGEGAESGKDRKKSRKENRDSEKQEASPGSSDGGNTAANDSGAPAQQDVIVKDDMTKAEKREMRRREKARREEKRKNREELIGAAAAGIAIGAVIEALGGKVVGDEGDRIVIESNGRLKVRKDENERLRVDGATVRREDLGDGRTRTVVTRPNGVRVITVRDRGGFILRRVKVLRNGDRIVLVDEEGRRRRGERTDFDRRLPPLRIGIDRERYIVESRRANRRQIREALRADPVERVEREYTLSEVRDSERLRAKLPRVDLDTITFDTDSAAVTRSQVDELAEIGNAIAEIVEDDPRELFLVEGHTDAVGRELYNLTLSDRRAETIARILTDRYGVPPENLIVEGYGEQYLKIDTQEAERANRRVTLRRITPLLNARKQ